MRPLDFIPVKFTLFLIFGILAGYYTKWSPVLPLLFTLISFLFLTVLFIGPYKKKGALFGMAMTATVVGVGMLAVCIAQPTYESDHYSLFNLQENHRWHLKVREVLKSGFSGRRYVAEVLRMDNASVGGRLLIQVAADSLTQDLKEDEEILVGGTLAEIRASLNPGQFNYKAYLEDLGIYHQLYLSSGAIRWRNISSSTVLGMAGRLRGTIIQRLEDAGFSGDELDIVKALLLGERKDIRAELYEEYQNAGAVHILAVSGLHIGIILMLLKFLLAPLRRLPHGKTAELLLIVLLLWAFAFLAGFSASVVRAVTMFTFLAYALYLNRPGNTFNIVALSLFFILLLINPMLLFQAGFQMSYAAVIAIIWGYPGILALWSPKYLILQKAWQLMAVSLAAQLGVFPISLYYFHQFPALFFLSNLFIIPFLGVILGLGFVVIILAFYQTLPEILMRLYQYIIYVMNHIIRWLAHREAFLFREISFDVGHLMISYLLVFLVLSSFARMRVRNVILFLVVVVIFQLWSLHVALRLHGVERTLLLHQSANTVLLQQSAGRLRVHTADTLASIPLVKNYAVASAIRQIYYLPLENHYQVNGRRILVVDSTLTSNPPALKTDILLLTQSPRIHLQRYLDSLSPRIVIADGSNYRAYIQRWQKTCAEKKQRFYYTGEQGALDLHLIKSVDIAH